MSETTVLEKLRASPRGSESSTEALGLAIAWGPDDADLVGEVILLPRHDGTAFVIGRGPALPEDPHPRVLPARFRPGRRDAGLHAISSPRVSRVQLVVRAGASELAVENVGRCVLLHNGHEMTRSRVEPGDTLQLGGALLLLCVRRPVRFPGEPEPSDDAIPFGRADDGGFVGESPAAWQLRRHVAFVAPRPDHVLILGPSGTGKELVARDIHARSSRTQKPMVSRNAATLPEGLIDAELFGHAKNFPNPGMADRPGLVGQAAGSTLFLDEFAELPLAMQAHLLRVLDEGEYQRLGETEARKSNFRLIAATNRQESSIKDDVLARFMFHVEIPGLNERREDIPLLVAHLMRELGRGHSDVAAQFFPAGDLEAAPQLPCSFVRSLVVHPFTTHVRELRKLLWRALAHHIEGTLPITEQAGTAAKDAAPRAPPRPESSRERALTPEAIQACLDRHNGVVERAWRELGLSNRYALRRLVAKHRLEIRKRKKR